MNNCDKPYWFNSNYDWGFTLIVHRLYYSIALFVDDELYKQIIVKLELNTNSLEL